MEQNFGVFVREKRLEKGLKLKAFAGLIGISPVYESYIECGKRPAPTAKILDRMVSALSLSPAETETLMHLAAASHSDIALPQDLVEYISGRKYVCSAIRIAKEYNADEQDWLDFISRITEKHTCKPC